MTAVVADVFWHLVAGLCEINQASVSVPAVDEIVENCFLVAFTNQGIKDDNILVVHRKLFKVDYFTSRRLDGFIANLGVDSGGKVSSEGLKFVSIESFRKTGKPSHEQATCKASAAGWLFFRRCWGHESAFEKHQLACKDGLICSCSWWKNLDHNLESSYYISRRIFNSVIAKWKVAILKTKSATIAFFSSPSFPVLSFFFVTVILELLGLKKPAF